LRIAALFPGQGAQRIGMGLSLLEKDLKLQRFLEEASDLVGWDVRKVIESGPKEVLDRTDKCQVAILVISWITFCYFKDSVHKEIYATAGLSLGEYGALLSAGVFDFATAVKLVDLRGRLMQEASERISSGMSAVIGLDEMKVRDACDGLDVYPANFNAPGQIVVSGRLRDLEIVEGRLKNLGAKRIVRLAVAGAFHSPLMSDAQERFNEELDKVEFNDPQILVFSSISGEKIHSGEEAKSLLKRQLTSPTLWQRCVECMCQEVDEFWEMEPSGVLRSLMRKTCSKTVNTL